MGAPVCCFESIRKRATTDTLYPAICTLEGLNEKAVRMAIYCPHVRHACQWEPPLE